MPVTSGVIDQFLHPPLGVLVNWLDGNGPFTGDNVITDWQKSGSPGVPLAITFGVLVQGVGTFPAEWGFYEGADMGGGTPYNGAIWVPRIAQLVVQHQLNVLGGGPFVTTQLVDIRTTGTLVTWDVALPGRLGLYCAPGWSFDLQFLQTP